MQAYRKKKPKCAPQRITAEGINESSEESHDCLRMSYSVVRIVSDRGFVSDQKKCQRWRDNSAWRYALGDEILNVVIQIVCKNGCNISSLDFSDRARDQSVGIHEDA